MSFEEILKSVQFVNVFWQLLAPLIFMLADVVTGIIQAVINNDLDSKVMRKGLLRKALLIIILLLSVVIEKAFGMKIISKIISLYLILMEVISIAENLTKAGIDIGKFGTLLKATEKKEEEEKDE